MMAPRTLMSSLLLLAVSMWGWGAPTRVRLASREACMRLCWYNRLCKSLRWDPVTGDCDVFPTQLNTSQSGVITITAASLEEHWEFPNSSHPCAKRPCAKGDLCVPVEKATNHICLRTDYGLSPLTADVTGYNTTTPNDTECIPVPQSCLDLLNATTETQQDFTANLLNATTETQQDFTANLLNATTETPQDFTANLVNATTETPQDFTAKCNVTCDKVNGNYAICHFNRRFITCVHGIANFMPCAAATVFDGTTGKCEHAN